MQIINLFWNKIFPAATTISKQACINTFAIAYLEKIKASLSLYELLQRQFCEEDAIHWNFKPSGFVLKLKIDFTDQSYDVLMLQHSANGPHTLARQHSVFRTTLYHLVYLTAKQVAFEYVNARLQPICPFYLREMFIWNCAFKSHFDTSRVCSPF